MLYLKAIPASVHYHIIYSQEYFVQSLALKKMLCKRESYSLIWSQNVVVQSGTNELRHTIVIGTRVDSVIITL